MRPLYIFDLDGTLADCEHRVHHIQKPQKDWDAFYAACGGDKPILATLLVLDALVTAGADVWVWSGRRGDQLNTTLAWFDEWNVKPREIKMRPMGDWREDTVLKKGWLDELSEEDRNRIAAVFEDRASVVAMWRAAGLVCYQVAPGAF